MLGRDPVKGSSKKLNAENAYDDPAKANTETIAEPTETQ